MDIFDWKDEYSVGYREIDDQHKRLFELAGELHAAMAAGKGKAEMSKTLANLVAYTPTHFASEERLMQLNHYPDYVQHKAAHDALTKQVVEFQRDFETGRSPLTIGLMQFLKDWLREHIGNTDRKIAAFLIEKAA